MGSSMPNRLDIFEIYARYCDIVSRNDHATSKELLAVLSKSLEYCRQRREAIFNDIYKLMSCLDLSVDSRNFNCFYGFVFFFCRESGQKNITVHRAITAWRLVLNGRFRLLNQWCNFVQEHQRHNISEDTWQQVLAFSRCVNEDLEGYDPKGAWPVLIDDFVEHMYRCRISQSKNCSTEDYIFGFADMEEQPSISNTFSGLNLLPGSKRKPPLDTDEHDEEESKLLNPTNSYHLMKPKRLKQNFVARSSDLPVSMVDGTADYHAEMNKYCSLGCLQTSACAVEDSLSKGFEGYLSIECCLQFDKRNGVSYT
ncbi:Defective in cullin neddylation protein [Cocos nucifera]|uniref:Defective in cullin neddylation protein n=1 Tax=Cocos nucifera TaxID=13894 RepID=A0A8K0I2B1_COCNU|nr:Defective in cullin neddylation protein [Cocos nucifera]